MIRSFALWSAVTLLIIGLFCIGALVADSKRPTQEMDYPPLLRKMPSHTDEALQFTDEAARDSVLKNRQRPPRDPVAEGATPRPGSDVRDGTMIFMSYDPTATHADSSNRVQRGAGLKLRAL